MQCFKNPLDNNLTDPLLDRFSYLYELFFENKLEPFFYKTLTDEQKILFGLNNKSSLKNNIISEVMDYYIKPNNLESVKKLIKKRIIN